MDCMVCGRPLPKLTDTCAHCNFQHYGSLTDPEATRPLLIPVAKIYRADFLQSFDLGITTYHWKDQDGTIVLDTTKRLSFGTARQLAEGTIWLDQEFARLPDENELIVELDIVRKDKAPYPIQVRIPALKEKQLQRVGLHVNQDLKVCLVMKNQDSEVSSNPVDFF